MAKKTKERTGPPKPRSDAYVAMLFITLLAIATGCVLMYLDWDEYGQKPAPNEKPPALQKLGDLGTAPTTPPGG